MKTAGESNVDRLALLAAKDEEVFAALLKSYEPFIFSRVRKISGRPYIDAHDDLASVGIIAFYDAVRTFDADKGSFLPFAETVIRNRVIDQLRLDARAVPTVPLYEENPEDGTEQVSRMVDLQVYASHGEAQEADMRRMEIAALSVQLEGWGISYAQVYADAPKRESGRAEIRRAVGAIIKNPLYLESVLTKKQLPIHVIEKDLGIPRKKLEKSRRFMVASILIASGDYPILREYLQLDLK